METNNLEKQKNVGWSYAIIYQGEEPVGYAITGREADAICDKQPNFFWDYKEEIPNGLPLLSMNMQTSSTE